MSKPFKIRRKLPPPETVEEIAKKFKISKETMQQIKKKIAKALK